MPAPPVVSVTPTNIDVAATSHPINIGTTANGDLLVMGFTGDDETAGGAVYTTPGGWTQKESRNSALKVWGKIYIRKTDGSDSGGTVDVTSDKNMKATAQVYRFAAGTWNDTGDLNDAVFALGVVHASTVNPDPPNLDTGLGAAEDFMSLAFTMRRITNTVASDPANYTNTQRTITSSNGAKTQSCRREVNATAENPGTWTENTAAECVSFTVMVRALADILPGLMVTQAYLQVPDVATPVGSSRFFGIGVGLNDEEQYDGE